MLSFSPLHKMAWFPCLVAGLVVGQQVTF
uniref:Uncharacterized protein n=1 Tax=Anguilla anguilla TaxID=7936 RepID=A0A0E9W6G2_ANGAN